MIPHPQSEVVSFGFAELLMLIVIISLMVMIGPPDLPPTEHEWGTGTLTPETRVPVPKP